MIRLVLILGVLSMNSCSLIGIRTTEEAPYNTSLTEGDIEIREYDPIVKVSVSGEGDFNESSNKSFRKLFNYISGENVTESKVQMTAPVFMQDQKIAMTSPVIRKKVLKLNEANSWTMSFILPKGYTLKTAPKPLDPELLIELEESKKVAVLKFSGFISEKKAEHKFKQLQEWATKAGIELSSTYRVAGYDPPWTIPFLRRNEILVDVQ